jgi:hypothetical protein
MPAGENPPTWHIYVLELMCYERPPPQMEINKKKQQIAHIGENSELGFFEHRATVAHVIYNGPRSMA